MRILPIVKAVGLKAARPLLPDQEISGSELALFESLRRAYILSLSRPLVSIDREFDAYPSPILLINSPNLSSNIPDLSKNSTQAQYQFERVPHSSFHHGNGHWICDRADGNAQYG